MSVHRTKDGRWYVKYYIAGQREKPKKKYFGRGPGAKVAAEDWDIAWKRSKKTGIAHQDIFEPEPDKSSSGVITFLDVAAQYISTQQMSFKHKQSLAYMIDKYVVPLFGAKPISELSMADLIALDQALQSRPGGRSVATRNRYKSYCKTICQWGVDNDLIPINPFGKLKRETKREAKAPQPPTADETNNIYKHSPDHLKWVITCMINTGFRPGPTELFAVKMDDIDFEQCGIWITRTKDPSRAYRVLQPVRPDFMRLLEQLKDKEPNRIWLIEYKGKHVNQVARAWASAKKKAGIPASRKLRLYELRHLYATTMLRDGADIKSVSRLMGHADPSITLSVYHHVLEEHIRGALDHLPGTNIPDDDSE